MRAETFTVTLQKIIQLGSETRHFTLSFDPSANFDFMAGQFVNFLIDIPGREKTIKRPYSIASPPFQRGTLDIVWKRVEGGLITNYFWTLCEGDKLKILGPLGGFTLKTPLPKSILFISTGTGVAPFRSMIHELLRTQAPCEIWNIFGNRYEDEILYQEEFEQLAAKHTNFKNILTVSKPKTWKGESAYVHLMLQKYFSDGQDKHLYICGLSNMIQAVRETAAAMGFNNEQIFFEKYA